MINELLQSVGNTIDVIRPKEWHVSAMCQVSVEEATYRVFDGVVNDHILVVRHLP